MKKRKKVEKIMKKINYEERVKNKGEEETVKKEERRKRKTTSDNVQK